jgi:hypothetical protein
VNGHHLHSCARQECMDAMLSIYLNLQRVGAQLNASPMATKETREAEAAVRSALMARPASAGARPQGPAPVSRGQREGREE